MLLGVGANFDVLPESRITTDLNHLYFANTFILEFARQRGGIDRDIGWDLSTAVIVRPFASQHLVLRMSGAVLFPGSGLRSLIGASTLYSMSGDVVLRY